MATIPTTTEPTLDQAALLDNDASFELVNVPLPTLSAEQRALPIRPGDLVRLLLAEPDLAPSDRALFAQFARLIGSVFHYEFYSWLTELKELYAPIDPDSDCVTIPGCSARHEESADEAFLGPFEAALIRANFVPLDLPILEQAISTPNELGLDYIPNLGLFEHLRVYVRGPCRVTREVRGPKTMFRRKSVTYDAYRRVVIALKFRPSRELDHYVRSDVLYLRMYKDVPYIELDMHLPEHGTKVRMRWIDKLQVASPVMTGIPTLVAKLLFAYTVSPMLLAGILFAPISAGLKSFLGYKTAKQRYLHQMIRHLYYLTLANNSSVINRLIDSGEEEEFKEALLAYYVLWRGQGDPEPWDQARLAARVVDFLRERLGLDLYFEVADALNKLFRLGLVQRNAQGQLLAIPVERALESLDQQWDHYFNYGRPVLVPAPSEAPAV